MLAELAWQLAEERRWQGITQASLGAALGKSGVSIANWESGRVPSVANFVRWADALGRRLVVVDREYAVWSPPRPVPRGGGEETHLYRLRVLALTLRQVRLEAGLTQEQVGQRLGVSGWTVQMWENSARLPRMGRLADWCGVLGCRIELR